MGNYFTSITESYVFYPPEKTEDIQHDFIQVNDSDRIPFHFIRCPGSKRVILFSHGNATDIDKMLKIMDKISKKLRCSIILYEYLGYGHSVNGSVKTYPSEQGCYDSILATYRFLIDLGYIPENIIAMGQSVGSGPTVYLAHREKVGRVVLITPFLSVAKVVTNSSWLSPLDIFTNDKRISRIDEPILFIHGTDDEVIDIQHSKDLMKLCNNSYEPCWVKGASHNDILFYDETVNAIYYFINI